MAKEKWLIPEEKSRRIATAFIVAGVLLAVVLSGFVIYSSVYLGVTIAKDKRLNKRITELEQIIVEREGQLEAYESWEERYHQAVERGWKTR